MNANEVVKTVIQEVVKNNNQPDAVANALHNWYEQILLGNESVESETAETTHMVFDHLEYIFSHIETPNYEDDLAGISP